MQLESSYKQLQSHERAVHQIRLSDQLGLYLVHSEPHGTGLKRLFSTYQAFGYRAVYQYFHGRTRVKTMSKDKGRKETKKPKAKPGV